MRYLKATFAGILFAVLFVVGATIIELLRVFGLSTAGNAGIGAVSVGFVSALPAAILGFVVGFVFTVRRLTAG